jgi:hypothetical protein
LGKSVGRGFRVVTGEKHAFTTTVWYWTRADGTVKIPPLIIHQGGDDEKMPAQFSYGLPDDWMLHCTQSGYNDHDGFKAICAQFVKYSEAGAENPQYAFMDAHESHWDSAAIDYFAANHVHLMFLRSNASIQDQPNDNGPNEMLGSCYTRAVAEWRTRHPGVKFTPLFFNV